MYIIETTLIDVHPLEFPMYYSATYPSPVGLVTLASTEDALKKVEVTYDKGKKKFIVITINQRLRI